MKFLFFILIASAAISLTKSTDPLIKHDITTLLNNTIARTFQNLDTSTIKQLISEYIKNYDFDSGVHYELSPIYNEFYFSDVKATVLDLGSVSIKHEFSESETRIWIPVGHIKIEGYVEMTNGTFHKDFHIYVNLDCFLMVISKPDLPENNEKLSIRIEYEENINYNFARLYHGLPLQIKYELLAKFKQMFPSIFLDYLQHHEKFLEALNTTFCNDPKNEILSHYPDFQHNPEQYYYFIPNITSLRRTLSNISITGLWNFNFYQIEIDSRKTENSGRLIETLKIENIRGNASLYYGPSNSTIFPLEFKAGSILITLSEEKHGVKVKSFDYSVSLINSNNSLTVHQSNWIIENIEVAIASSIMPSYRVNLNRYKLEHPIAQISTKISQQFHGRTIQKLYQDWNISKRENITIESNLQLESSYYNISVFCAPDESADPWPNWIHCHLYDYLEISFGQIRRRHFTGKIRLSNSTHEIDISFKMTDIVRLIKRNNSEGNDAFESENSSDIIVKLSSNSDKHDFTKKQLDVILQKTKQMLTSSILQTRLLFAKPLLHLPLDYCTTPVKLFDDFLSFIPDNQLAYYVPDASDESNQTFRISNVVIEPEKWKKAPEIWVSFYDYDEHKNLISYVNTELSNCKIRMSFTNASVQIDDLEFVGIGDVMWNNTETGEIEVQLYYDQFNIPTRYNQTLAALDPELLEEQLQYIVAKSFKKSPEENQRW